MWLSSGVKIRDHVTSGYLDRDTEYMQHIEDFSRLQEVAV